MTSPTRETGWIEATTHGHYVVEQPAPGAADDKGSWPLLVGFHGYAQTAEETIEHLRQIPGSERWVCCAVQGLHLFYRARGRDVAANWMTKAGREMAIADNIAYVDRVVDALKSRYSVDERRLVYCGFSQGGQMAWRAALKGRHACAGLIVLASDAPRDVLEEADEGFDFSAAAPVLLARGRYDRIYPAEKMEADLERAKARGVDVEPFWFEGGHGWERPFLLKAGAWLEAL